MQGNTVYKRGTGISFRNHLLRESRGDFGVDGRRCQGDRGWGIRGRVNSRTEREGENGGGTLGRVIMQISFVNMFSVKKIEVKTLNAFK
jgi:hypothetical protein